MADNVLWVLEADGDSVLAVLDAIDAGLTALEDSFASVMAAADSLTELTATFDEIDVSVGELAVSMMNLETDLQNTTYAADGLATSLDEVAASADGLGTIAAAADGASISLAGLTISADDAAVAETAAGDAGMAAATGGLAILAAALAMGGAAFFSMGMQAQDSMNTVGALTGASAQQMSEYTSKVEAMALKFGVSMKDAGDGLYYVLSAGFSGSNAMLVLNSAMMAARAGGVALNTVSDALTSSLNSYHAGAQQAAHYTDVMVTAVTQGKQSFQDLAGAIGPAAVTGHEAGFAFEEVAAAEATMTQSGFNAHRAVMDLDFLMRAIGVNIATVAKNAKGMGLAFDENTFKSDNLSQKLQYLQALTKGNTGEFEKLVGGSNGLAAAQIILGNHTQTYTGILDKMRNSTGTTETAFKASQQTISAASGKMGASLSVLAYNLTILATPYIVGAINSLSGVFSRFSALVSGNLSTALPIIAGLAVLIGGVLTAAIIAFLAPIVAAAGPVLLIIGAIALLAAGAVILAQHWNQLTAAFQQTGAFKMIQQVLTAIRPTMEQLRATAEQVWGVFLKTAMQVGSELRSTLAPVMKQLGDVVQNNLKPAWAALLQAFDASRPVLTFIGGIIGGVLAVAIGILIGLVEGLGMAFGQIIAGAAKAFGGIIQIFAGLAQIISGISLVIVDIVTGNWNKLGADTAKAWELIKSGALNVVKGMWAVIQGAFQVGVSSVIAFVSGFVSGIVHWFTNLYETLVGHSIVPDMINAIVRFFSEMPGKVIAFIVNLVTGAINWFNNMRNAISAAVTVLLAYVLNRFSQLPGQVLNYVIQMVTQALNWFHNMQTAGAAAVGFLVNSISNVLSQLPGIAVQWASDMMNQFISTIDNMAGNVGAAAQNVAGQVAKFLHFTKPDAGPLATADVWMEDFGTLLANGLEKQKLKLGTASLAIASTITNAVPNQNTINSAAGGAVSPGNSHDPAMLAVLNQILTVLKQQPGGASLVGGSNINIGSLNAHGVQDIRALYQELTTIAGLAQENAVRGAVAGF